MCRTRGREAHLRPLNGKSAELGEVGLAQAHAAARHGTNHAAPAQVEIGVERPHPRADAGQPTLKAPGTAADRIRSGVVQQAPESGCGQRSCAHALAVDRIEGERRVAHDHEARRPIAYTFV